MRVIVGILMIVLALVLVLSVGNSCTPTIQGEFEAVYEWDNYGR